MVGNPPWNEGRVGVASLPKGDVGEQPAILNVPHMAEQGSVIGPLHRQTQSTHSLGSQSYSRMRPRGSLDSPSPISQDFH